MCSQSSLYKNSSTELVDGENPGRLASECHVEATEETASSPGRYTLQHMAHAVSILTFEMIVTRIDALGYF